MKYPNGTGRHKETMAKVFDEIKKHENGVYKRVLHKRVGIVDADAEEHRVRVWQCNSALVALQNEKMIVRMVMDGQERYYAVGA